MRSSRKRANSGPTWSCTTNGGPWERIQAESAKAAADAFCTKRKVKDGFVSVRDAHGREQRFRVLSAAERSAARGKG